MAQPKAQGKHDSYQRFPVRRTCSCARPLRAPARQARSRCLAASSEREGAGTRYAELENGRRCPHLGLLAPAYNGRRPCPLHPAPVSAPTKSCRASAPAAWARSIARATRKLNRDVALKILPAALRGRSGPARALPARSAGPGALNHPNIAADLRVRGLGRRARARHGAGRGRRPVGAHRARSDAARRGAADRAADRRRARGRARAGHRSSRSEAGQHQGPRRRHGEGARLRPRQGAGARARPGAGERCRNSPTLTARGDAAGHDSRHGRLHVAGAGARASRRSARRHLGVRLRALRDAHRPARVRRRRT